MNKKQKMSRLQTYRLICDNCHLGWTMHVSKLKNNCVRLHKSSMYLCQLCANYENEVEKSEGASRLYNPFDLSAWGKRIVQKKFFYCCNCKTNIYRFHRLSLQTTNVVMMYSFRQYPFHSFWTKCFTVYMTSSNQAIAPEFCCKPHNSTALKIVTVTESIIWKN